MPRVKNVKKKPRGPQEGLRLPVLQELPRMSATAVDATSARPKKKPKPAPRARSLSPAGAAFIARFEGFASRLYNDAAGNATIGFGHLVHYGPVNGHELAEYRKGITRERALELLRQDAGAAAAAVRSAVRVKLTQPQFDALVSFAFNCGTQALRDSTLLRRLNAGNYAAVPAELAKWTHAGGRELAGLVTRRHAEGVLFAHGVYH